MAAEGVARRRAMGRWLRPEAKALAFISLTLTRTLTLTCERCERVEAEPARRQCAALRGRQPGGDLDEQIIGLDAVTEKGVTGWHGL